MKRSLIIILSILFLTNSRSLEAQNNSCKYVIAKKNGSIILAYKNFEDYLHSDKSWENYKKLMFEACPEIVAVHKKQLSWGSIDSLKFRDEVKKFKLEDWTKYLNQYDEKTLNFLYDSIIEEANKILPPIKSNTVDLCFFLPYGGCFVLLDNDKGLIFISLLIDPKDVSKIMIHEYAHCLHQQRRSEEPFTLKREIVSEGIAVYLTTLIKTDIGIANAIPFMPALSFKWCLDNEKTIKDSIQSELNDNTNNSLKKYIADGENVAKPPKGFVEKTGYFIGYQIIKACIDKGMKLEEICSLTSEEIIIRSGYFKN